MVFLSTDAGGVGLNLQAASAVINFEPPWNPARLEQRIGRVHRLGQSRPVHEVHMLTKGSIEERVWETLKLKKSPICRCFRFSYRRGQFRRAETEERSADGKRNLRGSAGPAKAGD